MFDLSEITASLESGDQIEAPALLAFKIKEQKYCENTALLTLDIGPYIRAFDEDKSAYNDIKSWFLKSLSGLEANLRWWEIFASASIKLKKTNKPLFDELRASAFYEVMEESYIEILKNAIDATLDAHFKYRRNPILKLSMQLIINDGIVKVIFMDNGIGFSKTFLAKMASRQSQEKYIKNKERRSNKINLLSRAEYLGGRGLGFRQLLQRIKQCMPADNPSELFVSCRNNDLHGIAMEISLPCYSMEALAEINKPRNRAIHSTPSVVGFSIDRSSQATTSPCIDLWALSIPDSAELSTNVSPKRETYDASSSQIIIDSNETLSSLKDESYNINNDTVRLSPPQRFLQRSPFFGSPMTLPPLLSQTPLFSPIINTDSRAPSRLLKLSPFTAPSPSQVSQFPSDSPSFDSGRIKLAPIHNTPSPSPSLFKRISSSLPEEVDLNVIRNR